jgi:hypothetical protein
MSQDTTISLPINKTMTLNPNNLVSNSLTNKIMNKLLDSLRGKNLIKVDNNVAELRLSIICRNVSRTFSDNTIKNFNLYISDIEHMEGVISICIQNIRSIINGNTLEISDVANFMNIIQTIYSEVNRLNQSNLNIKINSLDLIKFCSVVLETCLSVTLDSDDLYKSIVVLVNSAVGLITFNMNKTYTINCLGLLGCLKKK